MSEKVYTIEEIQKMLAELLKDKPVYKVMISVVLIEEI